MNKILSQIHSLELAYGEAALCRLGQHSFLVKLGKTVVGIDLYLQDSPSRLIPVEIPAQELEKVDLLLGSHDHSDHIDRATEENIHCTMRGVVAPPPTPSTGVRCRRGVVGERCERRRGRMKRAERVAAVKIS